MENLSECREKGTPTTAGITGGALKLSPASGKEEFRRGGGVVESSILELSADDEVQSKSSERAGLLIDARRLASTSLSKAMLARFSRPGPKRGFRLFPRRDYGGPTEERLDSRVKILSTISKIEPLDFYSKNPRGETRKENPRD